MDDLFGERPSQAHARRDDPDTSHEAAAAVSPLLNEVQRAVLAFAKRRGRDGFTDPELSAYFSCDGSTYRSRRAELVADGLIEDSGDRRRPEEGGRRFIVWRAVA